MDKYRTPFRTSAIKFAMKIFGGGDYKVGDYVIFDGVREIYGDLQGLCLGFRKQFWYGIIMESNGPDDTVKVIYRESWNGPGITKVSNVLKDHPSLRKATYFEKKHEKNFPCLEKILASA
jgi:hypothetical protein